MIAGKPAEDKTPEQHLFILGMNDSGTTFLQNSLSQCRNIVSFQSKARPHGMEGQGVSWWKKRQSKWYPRDVDHGVVKVYSEKKQIWQDPARFNWKQIKAVWNEAWKQNAHWAKADPRILLEKTPTAIFSVDIYLQQFPQAKFLIIHRNPYAICEGIKRTVKKYKKQDFALSRCAIHWRECTLQQIRNIEQLCPGQAIWFKYEDMVTQPEATAKRIMEFIPDINDLSFRKPVTCHSMDRAKPRPVFNYNDRHLRNLNEQQFVEINGILKTCPGVMEYFNYVYRDKAP